MRSISISIAFLIMLIAAAYSQWQQTAGTPQGSGVTDMVVLNDGTLIVTTASFNWPNGQSGGIRRSTDGGNSWQNVMNSYNARTLHLGTSGRIFASCWNYPQNEGMFFSADNGLNWIQTFFGAANDNVFSIAAKNGDSMVYVGTRNGVYRSFNNGAWIQLMSGMPVNSWVRDLAIIDGEIFAATTNGLFKSTNQGNSWSAISGLVPGDTVVKLVVGTPDETDRGEQEPLFVGTSNGRLYVGDAPYETFDITYFYAAYEISAITSYGIFVVMTLYPRGGGSSIVVYSTDRGETWSIFPVSGLPGDFKAAAIVGRVVSNYAALDEYELHMGLFMNQTSGAGIYKFNSVIGIEPVNNEVPNRFSLSQNYPNPFNPSTNIEFSIPGSGLVKLAVYDLLGKEIEVIANKHLNAGNYRVDWNASNYPSGVYFYKLMTGEYTETRKMILVK